MKLDAVPPHELVQAVDDAGVVHTLIRPRAVDPSSSRRSRFVGYLLIYIAVAWVAPIPLLVLAGFTGGPWGFTAVFALVVIALLLLMPGAILAAIAMTWYARRVGRPTRLAAVLISGGISALWLAAAFTIAIVVLGAGSDPYDARPGMAMLAGFGGVVGSLAGVAMAGSGR